MTSPDITSLQEHLQRIIETETFTGRGLDAFNAARAKAAELEKKLADRDASNEALMSANKASAAEIDRQRKELSIWAAKDEAIRKREAEATALEKKAAVAEAVATTWSSAFSLVFRNAEVRRTLHGQVPVYQGGNGYVAQHQTDTQETTTAG